MFGCAQTDVQTQTMLSFRARSFTPFSSQRRSPSDMRQSSYIDLVIQHGFVMSLSRVKPKSRGPARKPAAGTTRVSNAPAASDSSPVALGLDLPLPHERDESASSAAVAPDPVIAQAKRDIDAGMVDTDMSVTPGLDAKLRSKLVPGPAGKPPAVGT